MTYFTFLLLFVVTPAAVFTVLTRPTRGEWAVLGALLGIVYVWTTPWDNYLVGSGVWYYDPQLVSGLVLGWVPVEEYLFFGLQAWMTSMWAFGLRRWLKPDAPRPLTAPTVLAAGGGVALAAAAAAWLTPGLGGPAPAANLPPLPFGAWNYSVLILAWAVPVILGQAWLGWPAFKQEWRWMMGAMLTPAVYLTMVDSLALGAGTWTIAPAQSHNLFLPGRVPVEEGLFFLVTNVMLVQGLVLFTHPLVRARLTRWAAALRPAAAR